MLEKKNFFFKAFADTVITADQGLRGGKVIELKKTVDAAVAKCPSIKRVFVYSRTGEKVSKTDLDINLEEVKSNIWNNRC